MHLLKTFLFSFILITLTFSCKKKEVTKEKIKAIEKNTQEVEDNPQNNTTTNIPFVTSPPEVPNPISQFVRRIFQDSKGNYWFGTNGDGVLFYDGKKVTKYSIDEGFDAFAVRGIVEDKDGMIWFATENDLIIYDPKVSITPTADSFSEFAYESVIPHFDTWGLMIDSKDVLWINTYMGVASYDGEYVRPLLLPKSKKDPNRGVSHPKMVSSVFEDNKGNMWFSTPGGAYKDNGETLEHFSEEDGLPGSSVNQVIEDKNGDLWFATFYNGVSKYDGKTFTNYTKDGIITGDEVWSLFKDKEGNIWFPAEHHGVYKYDGATFTNYGKAQGLESGAIQCIFQDKGGVIWFGGYLGLFKLEGEKVVSVTKEDLETRTH